MFAVQRTEQNNRKNQRMELQTEKKHKRSVRVTILNVARKIEEIVEGNRWSGKVRFKPNRAQQSSIRKNYKRLEREKKGIYECFQCVAFKLEHRDLGEGEVKHKLHNKRKNKKLDNAQTKERNKILDSRPDIVGSWDNIIICCWI